MNSQYLEWVGKHSEWIILCVAIVTSFTAFVSLFTLRGIREKPLKTDDVIRKRLSEVRGLQKKYSKVMKRYGRAAFLLSFTQFACGAVISSSLFQHSSTQNPDTQNVIGVLGIVIVISSAIQQRYRPYSRSVKAEQRLADLKKLIRRVDLAIVERTHPNKIVRILNDGIDDAEKAEVTDYDLRIDDDVYDSLEKRIHKIEEPLPTGTDGAIESSPDIAEIKATGKL